MCSERNKGVVEVKKNLIPTVFTAYLEDLAENKGGMDSSFLTPLDHLCIILNYQTSYRNVHIP